MHTWILLLRGINVGGNSRLLMKDLKRILASFDLENVRTYIQSGNVTFQTSEAVSATLAEEIAARIEEHSGFRPHLFLLPADQFERAVAANPFPQAEAEPKSLHLFFLAEKPPAPALDALAALQSPTEHFHLSDRVFYLLAPDGIGRSRLAEKIGKHLGVQTTARNWRTVQKLQAMINSYDTE